MVITAGGCVPDKFNHPPEQECAMSNVTTDFARTILLSLAFFVAPAVWAQTRPIVIVGGTLIDGTGGAAIEDAVVVFQSGRIQDVGKSGEVAVPVKAQTIDAKGKTILPGLIDG